MWNYSLLIGARKFKVRRGNCRRLHIMWGCHHRLLDCLECGRLSWKKKGKSNFLLWFIGGICALQSDREHINGHTYLRSGQDVNEWHKNPRSQKENHIKRVLIKFRFSWDQQPVINCYNSQSRFFLCWVNHRSDHFRSDQIFFHRSDQTFWNYFI